MDFYPEKAQFLEKEEVFLCIENELTNVSRIEIKVTHLEKCVNFFSFVPTRVRERFSLGKYTDSSTGYGVDIVVIRGEAKDYYHTAFDIQTDKNASLRYGFVSDFSEDDKENGALEWLRKCHVNIVQYYDWSYRHDHLVGETEKYEDMMGKHIDASTVKYKIEKGHSYGMSSIAYGAVYAASRAFADKHPEWAFYYPNGEMIRFIDVFCLMNIEKDSPWRNHIIKQYLEAVEKLGFDGIHMDTYGFPKTAISGYGEKKTVWLDEEFGSLIDDTRDAFEIAGHSPCLIFNNVGNWPVYATADRKQNAVYVEVWHPYETYFHIMEIIRNAKIYSHNEKPIIIAAYLKPFRENSTAEGMNAARLLMAFIVSNGAYHLLTGENATVLTQGYYSDYTKLSLGEASDIRKYYDFMIRYFDLFYDRALYNASLTHFGGDNHEYMCLSHKISVSGEAGMINAVISAKRGRKVISLINLCGEENCLWNEPKSAPREESNITLKVMTDGVVKGVFYASPDEGPEAKSLDYVYSEEKDGCFVTFTIPALFFWNTVWIED